MDDDRKSIAGGRSCVVEVEADPSSPHAIRVWLRGAVTEHFDPTQVIDGILPSGEFVPAVVLDVGGVERINSAGVRNWLRMIGLLQSRTSIAFSTVGEAMVEQAMVIAGLLGQEGTPVEWFVTPYACAPCQTRVGLLLRPLHDVDLDAGKLRRAAPICSRCNQFMELDAMEEDYVALARAVRSR